MSSHGPLVPLVAVLLSVTVSSLALWVGLDARSRDANPLLWGLLGVALYPVFPVVFYLLRRRYPRLRGPTNRYYLARVLAGGSILSFAVATLAAPPDPVTQVSYWAVAFPVVVAGLYVFDRRQRDGGVTVGG